MCRRSINGSMPPTGNPGSTTDLISHTHDTDVTLKWGFSRGSPWPDYHLPPSKASSAITFWSWSSAEDTAVEKLNV